MSAAAGSARPDRMPIAAVNDVCHSRDQLHRAATVMPQTSAGMRAGSSGIYRVPLHRSLIVVPLVCAAAGLLAGCSGASDLLSRDADWFAGRPRVLGNS